MPALSTSAHLKSPSALKRWVAAHPVVTFFLLAYALTWGIIGGAMLAIGSGAMAEGSPLVAILQELYSFGPALAALAAAAAIAGWRGLREVLGSLDPRRIGLGWYPLALVAPPLALVLAEAAVHGAAPLAGMVAQWPAILSRYLLPILTTVLLTTGIAEELGWRGFAQPRLQARYGPLARSLILGAGAALWHLPNAVLRPGGLPIFARVTTRHSETTRPATTPAGRSTTFDKQRPVTHERSTIMAAITTTQPASPSSLKQAISRHPLLAYFALAFAGSWGVLQRMMEPGTAMHRKGPVLRRARTHCPPSVWQGAPW